MKRKSISLQKKHYCCSLCLEPNELIVADCFHSFHRECLLLHLETFNHCPVCHHDLTRMKSLMHCKLFSELHDLVSSNYNWTEIYSNIQQYNIIIEPYVVDLCLQNETLLSLLKDRYFQFTAEQILQLLDHYQNHRLLIEYILEFQVHKDIVNENILVRQKLLQTVQYKIIKMFDIKFVWFRDFIHISQNELAFPIIYQKLNVQSTRARYYGSDIHEHTSYLLQFLKSRTNEKIKYSRLHYIMYSLRQELTPFNIICILFLACIKQMRTIFQLVYKSLNENELDMYMQTEYKHFDYLKLPLASGTTIEEVYHQCLMQG